MGVGVGVWRFRGLLWTLTARELKARYRGSLLGFVWSLVNPLLLLSVYTLVFGVVFQPRFDGADPYAVYLVTGLFPWIWLSTSLLEGTDSLLVQAPLIRKAVFPSEILPLVAVLSNLVHFLLALPIVAVAIAVSRLHGHDLGGLSALVLPAVIVLQGVACGGAVMGLAALNAHFKDVKDLLANLLTLGFFLAPVLYPMSAVTGIPWVAWLVRCNPATPFVLAHQAALFHGTLPGPELWLQMGLLAAGAWLLGGWLHGRLADTLVEAV